jgi:hypothetical protein
MATPPARSILATALRHHLLYSRDTKTQRHKDTKPQRHRERVCYSSHVDSGIKQLLCRILLVFSIRAGDRYSGCVSKVLIEFNESMCRNSDSTCGMLPISNMRSSSAECLAISTSRLRICAATDDRSLSVVCASTTSETATISCVCGV